MPRSREHGGDLVVHRVHERGAAGEGREPRTGGLERVLVAVDADHVRLRATRQHGLAVAAEAEGRVHEDRARRAERRRHQRDDPVEEDRDVGGVGI